MVYHSTWSEYGCVYCNSCLGQKSYLLTCKMHLSFYKDSFGESLYACTRHMINFYTFMEEISLHILENIISFRVDLQ